VLTMCCCVRSSSVSVFQERITGGVLKFCDFLVVLLFVLITAEPRATGGATRQAARQRTECGRGGGSPFAECSSARARGPTRPQFSGSAATRLASHRPPQSIARTPATTQPAGRSVRPKNKSNQMKQTCANTQIQIRQTDARAIRRKIHPKSQSPIPIPIRCSSPSVEADVDAAQWQWSDRPHRLASERTDWMEWKRYAQ
jgi:hypothetical protein